MFQDLAGSMCNGLIICVRNGFLAIHEISLDEDSYFPPHRHGVNQIKTCVVLIAEYLSETDYITS